MGVVFFIVFIIFGLLFLSGLFLLLLGIVSAILLKVKGKKIKNKKKIYSVLPIIPICAGIIILIIPIIFIFTLREFHADTYAGYVKTKTLTYYDAVNIDRSSTNYSISSDDYINSFILNKSDYIMLDPQPAIYNVNLNNLTAVANVKVKENAGSSFLDFILNNNSIDTIYYYKSSSNFEILYSSKGRFYCKKSDLEKVIDYYNMNGKL